MTDNDKYIQFDEQVDRYLFREMTPQEEADFVVLLDANPELKRRAASTAVIIRGIEQAQREKDAKVIQGIKDMSKEDFLKLAGVKSKAVQATPNFKIKPWKKWASIAAAACVLAFVCVTGWRWQHRSRLAAVGEEYCGLCDFPQEFDYPVMRASLYPYQSSQQLTDLFVMVQEGKDLENAAYELQQIFDNFFAYEYPLNEAFFDIGDHLAIAYLKLGQSRPACAVIETMIENCPDQDKSLQLEDLLSKIQ